MCLDAINNHIMQQMIASGQIEVPTGIPKMELMIPSGGLQPLSPVVPIEYDMPKRIPAMWGAGNVVEYNLEDFNKSLESAETFKAAYPGFKGFLHHIWYSVERSVAMEVQ